MNSLLLAISVNANEVGIPNVLANDATFNAIVGLVYTVIAASAIFFIIFGGIQFVVSAGDASKVKNARQTILYAVIGLVGSTLVFAIVHFISGSITGSSK